MCLNSQRITRDLEGTRKEKWELLDNVIFGQCDSTMPYLCIVLEKEKYSRTDVLFCFFYLFVCL